MKIKISATLFVTFSMLVVSLNLRAQDNIEYGENYIVFEAEETSSSLSKWVIRKPGDPEYLKYETLGSLDPINETYLEYTGPWLGGPDTELVYTFICPKSGNYRMLMRMHQPLREGEAHDQRNDVFVRLEGNYTSATSKPKSELEKNHKFWGRGPNKWGTCHSLEIGTHLPAIYGLTKGEEYTFTMSGRSNGTSIDYILFYENIPGKEITGQDLAIQFPEEYRPGPHLVDPVGISIDPDTTTIRQGTSLQLKTLWEPDNAKKDLGWISSEDQIISVDSTGVITARGEIGQRATITATSLVNDSSASCEVSIVEWYAIPIESISVSPEGDTVAVGVTISLTANVSPLDSDDPSIIWSSSDKAIARVDSNGVVTTIATGNVKIRATSNAIDTIYDESSIVVAQFIQPFVEFDDNDKYLNHEFKTGDSMQVTINYHAGTFQTVKDLIKIKLREIKPGWQVEKDVFSVDIDSLAGTNSGTLTITIPLEGVAPSHQLSDGHFYYLFVKCFYTNNQTADKGLSPIQISSAFPVESISVSPSKDTIAQGSTLALTASILPANSEDTSVVWSSSNPYYAAVDQNGILTAHWPGTISVRATSSTNDTIYGEASIEIISVVSVENQLTELGNVILYPNPSTVGYIGISGLEPGSYSVEVYNMAGAKVQKSKITPEQNITCFLDLNKLTQGKYLLLIKGNGTKIRSSFIILK